MRVRTAARPLVFAVVSAVAAVVLTGCTTTVRALAPQGQKPSYEISCMQPADCERAARTQCGGTYSTVRAWHNRIPDSELPGLNAQTQRRTERSTRPYDHPDWILPYGPGIESEAPLPITEVVVVCG